MADNGSEAGEGEVAAGDFSAWLVEIQGAIRGDGGADVPCGGCTACCTSSQFVHITPDETDTLAHIPPELLFPAPRRPDGHVLLGYDERGHCPMLVDGCCSIYEHRPRACRTYDCRVFPAAGLDPGADGKVGIARQARRWRFSSPSLDEKAAQDAVRAAARFLRQRPDLLAAPTSATRLAALAVEIHELFLGEQEPDPGEVRAAVLRRRGVQPGA
ncbi:MAG: YkgJ family cysteine cluster protein [Actinomycetota bacterium]|nr:YkgJ family cysteine cluster protein [Actinomycetota bacterium]